MDGKVASDLLGLNIEGRFVLAVDGVKVRRAMFPIEHTDDNSEEAGNLWHLTSKGGTTIQRRINGQGRGAIWYPPAQRHSRMRLNQSDRFRGCLLGLATGDAVGTPAEFGERGSFEPLSDMVGGGPFKLLPGQWTDDT